jgi:Fe-Mn family superoxide dismutase
VDNGNKADRRHRVEKQVARGDRRRAPTSRRRGQSGIFNNASQHWNHNQFWQWMTPATAACPARSSARSPSLRLGPGLQDQFNTAGVGQFGSGWVWLVKDKDGSLKITKTENGVNPLCFGQTALLGCDVWEHSYYIDFRNKRPPTSRTSSTTS